MSTYQTFPDVIVYRNGTARLVTQAARSWTYSNTALSDHCEIDSVPDVVAVDVSVAEDMEHDGLVVKRK